MGKGGNECWYPCRPTHPSVLKLAKIKGAASNGDHVVRRKRWQLWISRDNGGGSSSNKLKDTRTELVPRRSMKNFDNSGPCWTLRTGTESNKTVTWASPPYYFVSVVTDKGIHRPYYFVSYLNWVSVLIGGVTANGFKWRIQGDGEAIFCACHLSVVTVPLFLFTPSTVILWLCFDMTVVCVWFVCAYSCLYMHCCNLAAPWWASFRISSTLNFELWYIYNEFY